MTASLDRDPQATTAALTRWLARLTGDDHAEALDVFFPEQGATGENIDVRASSELEP